MKKILTLLSTIFILSFINAPAMADDVIDNGECIVGQVNHLSLADEFGEAVPAITRCLEKTDTIKLVMQVNKACRDTSVKVNTVLDENGNAVRDDRGNILKAAALENHARSCVSGRGYGIAQMKNMIKDWKITHGIDADKLDLNIIVHGGGGTMLLGAPWNKLKGDVQALLNDGVKFHFCMNTVRGMVKKMRATTSPNMTIPVFVNMVMPGVTYVTGGLTALSDFQSKGYTYIHP